MELTRPDKRAASVKATSVALESTMPEELAKLLRAERTRREAIPVPQAPKPQKPSYGVPGFTPQGELRYSE
jgi:hypothetical protein